MIRFRSEKAENEFSKASVVLRLVAEALDIEASGISVIFRVLAPAKFENGTHAAGLALDMELGCSEDEGVKACAMVNRRFRTDTLDLVCISKVNRSNFPSGARTDRPHVHVQVPRAWTEDPRAFLRRFDYLES